MLVIAVNGSPRKTWNTATLLKEVLKGARAAGADTELVHLYDLDYAGCKSCFACKKVGGRSYGRCAVRDGLRPILEGILPDTMYELPTYDGVEEVVVNAEVVDGRAQPLIIYAERRDKGGAA